MEYLNHMISNFAAPLLRDSTPYFPQAGSNTIASIFNYVFGLLGIIAVIMVIYGSIQMIISQGNSEKVATARRTVIYALVGLVVIGVSGALVNFLVVRLA